jgi:iron-sulfur cluster repair protein YtfE (RIC family)
MKRKESISADLTILDVVSDYPETEAIFKTYDEKAGECLCCQCLFETLQQVAETYNLDLPTLLAELNSTIPD